MRNQRRIIERGLGRPIANASFLLMDGYVRSMQKSGVAMLHTARSFSYYRKVFYKGQSKSAVLSRLANRSVVDVGCGYTPYAEDSMFRACHNAGIDFYGIDPIIGSNPKFGLKEQLVSRATGGNGRFNAHPPGINKAISASAQCLPFEDHSVDEILCSFLLFVWIKDQDTLADILGEFLRVLKVNGTIKIYPLHEWRFLNVSNKRLQDVLANFNVEQTFVHGAGDFRVTPSLLTEMTVA
ncbi:MAG: class I SAM-dependent methyltransferase [Pseudomonadales bacterium]